MIFRPLNEKGLTLTEVTIVAAIGTLVLLGMGGFYLQSQATWLDGSAQSLTQREVTLVTQAIVDSVRVAHQAQVTASPDATHHDVALAKASAGGLPFYHFWWSATDSLVHGGTSPGAADDHAMMQSPVDKFVVAVNGGMVRVSLRARAATGQFVEFSGSARMRN
ncbi:MAG: hypothetical protein HZA61_01085 [Candidatus Eisenbacteria bacterium]|uniref:Uncharacterized protein n=1 Tax=Eiseniibacteriota bacterium TaxID=2212470 RepID=A0A933W966_UNCEI|nr:hypothetical protein [Candidatus Eisenbacteria bacterium]